MLSILLAVPAAVILVSALLRGRLPQPLMLAGMLLSFGAYGKAGVLKDLRAVCLAAPTPA